MNPQMKNYKVLISEYSEGCGFNIHQSFEINDEKFEFWASKYPFNYSNVQNYVNRILKDCEKSGVKIEIEQNLIYSQPFEFTS